MKVQFSKKTCKTNGHLKKIHYSKGNSQFINKHQVLESSKVHQEMPRYLRGGLGGIAPQKLKHFQYSKMEIWHLLTIFYLKIKQDIVFFNPSPTKEIANLKKNKKTKTGT